MRTMMMGGVAVLLLGAAPLAAQFTGNVVGVQDCSGVTTPTGCSNNWNMTPTGPGVEATPLLPVPPFPAIFLDISDARIVLGLEPGTASIGFGAPFALRFFDLNGSIAPILSATLSGAGLLSDPSRLTFNANEIFLNLQGAQLAASPSAPRTIAQIDVTFAATTVPEPATLALVLTGLVGIAARSVGRPTR